MYKESTYKRKYKFRDLEMYNGSDGTFFSIPQLIFLEAARRQNCRLNTKDEVNKASDNYLV